MKLLVPFLPAQAGQRVLLGLVVRSKQGVDQNGWLMNWTENSSSCDQLLWAWGEQFPGCFIGAADAGTAIRSHHPQQLLIRLCWAISEQHSTDFSSAAPILQRAVQGIQRDICIPLMRWMPLHEWSKYLCFHSRCAVPFYFCCATPSCGTFELRFPMHREILGLIYQLGKRREKNKELYS